jgi:hypothetical protein
MENQIVFRAYNSKRQTPVRLSPLEDRSGKLYTGQGEHGFYELLSEKEKAELPILVARETVVTIENGTVLNLNDPIDSVNWKWIQKHPYIALDKQQGEASRDAVFYVDNPEKEAEVHITRDKKLTMAKAKIYGASHNKKIQLAQALGNPAAKTLSTDMLEDWLITKASDVPDTITKLLDKAANAKLNAMILYEDLKRFGMVTRHAGTWRFGGREGIPIGNDDEEVFEFLLDKKNEEQVFLMNEQLKEKKGGE